MTLCGHFVSTTATATCNPAGSEGGYRDDGYTDSGAPRSLQPDIGGMSLR